MQRQFSIELRVDYADKGKTAVMRKAIAQAARHVFATAALLADNGAKPQIAVFSDDYFDGHQEIAFLEDVIEQGTELLAATGDAPEEPISAELLEALGGKK